MTNASKHIIEKINLEFNTTSENQGKQLERQSVDILQNKLLPRIEQLFENYGAQQNIQLENLSIEIDVSDPIRFEDQFIDQFLKQLAQKLDNIPSKDHDEETKTKDLFVYFLQYGHFPWWSQIKSVKELEDLIFSILFFIISRKREPVERIEMRGTRILISS